MGYSVRVTQPRELRYTAWFLVDNHTVKVDTTARGLVATELYDFQGVGAYDPDWKGMDRNLVDDPRFKRFVPALHEMVIEYVRLI
eukprot:COSAG01_NODE_397_length_17560_cov_111.258347_8_plen_85_part_00